MGEEYFLDNDGYYITHEKFRDLSETKECPFCGRKMMCVFAERYLQFDNCFMMIMGLKIYGYECVSCNLCIPSGES